MGRWFTSYQKKDTLLNMEWQVMRGGFLHVGRMNWTFLHRFSVSGVLPAEKEFIFRFQVAFDHEPRFSWYTLELVNPYEARVFYLWVKLWKTLNFHSVLNFGWRLTKASRDMQSRMVLEREHRLAVLEKSKQNNGKGGNHGILRAR